MGEVHCFACGLPGHVRAECPKSARTRRTEAPAPDAAAAAPERERIEGLDYNSPEKRAQDVPGWAEKIQAACGFTSREDGLRKLAAEQIGRPWLWRHAAALTITERSGK